MRKSAKKLHTWKVVRIKGSPAANIGSIEAAPHALALLCAPRGAMRAKTEFIQQLDDRARDARGLPRIDVWTD